MGDLLLGTVSQQTQQELTSSQQTKLMLTFVLVIGALYTVCHGGLVCNAIDRLAKDEYRKSHLFQFFCRSPFVESVSRLRFLLVGARIVYAGHSRKCSDPDGIPESGHVCHDGFIRSAEHSGILFFLSHV